MTPDERTQTVKAIIDTIKSKEMTVHERHRIIATVSLIIMDDDDPYNFNFSTNK